MTACKLVSEAHGAHVHVRVFIGPDADHLALSGVLVMAMPEAVLLGAAMILGAKESQGHLTVSTEGGHDAEVGKMVRVEFQRRVDLGASAPDLIVDAARHERFEEASASGFMGAGTGIYVRAKRGEKWGSHDIVVLTRDSLQAWLRSRGEKNEWAESVVAILLGHAS